MKISMWIVYDWLEQFNPISRISKGEQTISGVRYLSEEITLSREYLYIGYQQPFIDSDSNSIICVNDKDIITLTAPDIYTVFNEIQQMLEFYNNWEMQILQAINHDKDINGILEMTLPVLKTGIALSDLSHKVFGEAKYEDDRPHELIDGYLSVDELQVINEQLRKNINRHTPYIVHSIHSTDIVRNFYSSEGQLIGWFVAMGGGYSPHLNSRLQLAEAFCSLLDLWYKIHIGSTLYTNLFLDILESKETDPSGIRFRLEGLGWSMDAQLQVVALSSCSGDVLGVSAVSRYLENAFRNVSGFLYQDSFAAVINTSIIQNNEFMDYLSRMLKTQNAYCGLSYEFSAHVLPHLRKYYQQACLTLDYGKKEPGAVNYCEDYALDYMRSRFQSALETDMKSPVLSFLKQYDLEHNTDYYETLKAYLYCERDQTLTAKVLCIHRNSLVYRINRLKELIPDDLDDENTRLYLLLSFFVSQ